MMLLLTELEKYGSSIFYKYVAPDGVIANDYIGWAGAGLPGSAGYGS
jgi:hypothetical protein